jgi:hypothetical protein
MKATQSVFGRAFLVAIVAGGSLSFGSAASAQQLLRLERLGTVEFEVGCNAGAPEKFNHAMALYHSFAWREAASAFAAVAEADASCGMAHWGRAMVMLSNPFVWPASLPPQKLDEVAGALDAARKAGLKSAREEGYVAAVEAFVRDHGTRDHRTRIQAFEQALGELAAKHPQDTEAAILHALVTSANFNPADKTYGNQMRAARILEPIYKARPDHPGVAHYLIHSYDYPPIAKHGLDAAWRYAGIAPDAPHALHMPSHIFTRLGQWRASIESNRAAAEAAGDATFDAHHAYDYMVYAHLQLAQDKAAAERMRQSLSKKAIDHFASAYAYAAMPARLALERDEWKQAAAMALQPSGEAYPWQKYPQAEAVNAFGRGVGAARSGDAAGAREQQQRLWRLRDAMKVPYWAEQIDIQADVVGALAQCADGKAAECREGLRRAAAREDATEKHVVTPGPILPARELLADILLEQGQAGEALNEYEAVLGKELLRYRAIAGAMRAAAQAGDSAKARTHAAALVKQAGEADEARPSIAEARRLAGG